MKILYHRDQNDLNLDNKHDYTRIVSDENQYHKLEEYIDELVDFAAEIREHEPTWANARDK